MQGLQRREREEVFEPDGWYRTGDAGHFDADGWFYFTGRLGEMIKTPGGANVTPAEVEAALMTYPDVLEAYVTGIPAEGGGSSSSARSSARRRRARRRRAPAGDSRAISPRTRCPSTCGCARSRSSRSCSRARSRSRSWPTMLAAPFGARRMTEARYPTITEAGPVHDQREIDAVVAVLQSPVGSPSGRRSPSSSGAAPSCSPSSTAVMVNSGTSALWLAVDLLGCEPGDEVITSPLTFSSDIAPLVRNGIVPAFVDVEPDTLQIDVTRIEAMIGPRTKAILTPNLVGNCPDWDAIREIADRHDLLVVEDSCDVLDSYLRGTRTGTRADISVTSFARGHSITAAGNGGMIAVDDAEWFDQIARAPAVGTSLGEATCSAASRATTTASARSPTARPTT